MSTKHELTPKQAVMVGCLLEGATVAQACKNAGVTERTGTRWLRQPEVKAELFRAEQAVLERTTRRLLALSEQALDSLERVLEQPGERGAGVRLRAVTVTLDSLVRLREFVELEERISALERQAKKK